MTARRSLRNDIAVCSGFNPEQSLNINYPAYTPLSEYLRWLEQGKSQSARDSFNLEKGRPEAELEFLVSDRNAWEGDTYYGFREGRGLLVPGQIYETPLQGYLRFHIERTNRSVVFEKVETEKGPIVRLTTPTPDAINLREVLKQMHGRFEDWSNIYNDYPFKLEMLTPGLVAPEMKVLPFKG